MMLSSMYPSGTYRLIIYKIDLYVGVVAVLIKLGKEQHQGHPFDGHIF